MLQNIVLQNINQRITSEFCIESSSKLADNVLLNDYKNCKSVKKSIEKLCTILEKHDSISNDIKNDILQEYLLEMIPPGTKGVIRGNKFNKIVQEKIESFGLSPEIYEIAFEKNCNDIPTSEIPDWYIKDKIQNKTIIGMNQLDLWGGGHQLNRAAKYILKNPFETFPNVTLICVVCNKIELKSEKNKAFRILEQGFRYNTICYLNNLETIIKTTFSENSL
jgi:hypothetical protein